MSEQKGYAYNIGICKILADRVLFPPFRQTLPVMHHCRKPLLSPTLILTDFVVNPFVVNKKMSTKFVSPGSSSKDPDGTKTG